jgi:pimeloyl-[acyl-carrier protein] methyl ester esterase
VGFRIVLLPGLDGTGLAHRALQSRLSPYESSAIPLATRSGGYAVDLQAALQHLPGTGPYVLVAESYSGPIGISIAATQPPGLVGLVLSTTFLSCPRPYLGQLRLLLKFLPPIRVPSAPFVPLLLNSRSTPEARELLRIVLGQASPKLMLTRLNDVARVDVTAEARSIKVPTLYLRASVDRVVPSSAGDAIQRHIPHATIAEVAGPHLLLQACPREAANRIKAISAACVPANNSFERTHEG